MSKLSKNILYNLAGQVALMLLNLVAVRATFRQLGEDVFGLFVLGSLIGAIFRGVSQGSFDTLVMREVSRYLHTDREIVRQTLRMCSLAAVGAFGVAVVALIWGAPWIVSDWINLSSLGSADATTLIRIVGIGALLSLPNTFLDAVLRGLEEMRYTNLIDVGITAIYRGGLVLLIHWGVTWHGAAWWFVVTGAASIVLLVGAILRFLPMSYLVPGLFPEVFRRNGRFVIQTTALGMTGLVHRQADKVIVGKLMPVAMLGYYSFAYALVNQMTSIRSAILSAALPSFARMFQQKQQARIVEQFETIHQLLSYGMVPLFAAVAFFCTPLYTYIFTADVAALMLAPTALLATGSYLSVLLATPNGVSLAFGRADINLRGNLLALMVVLPLTVVLIYYWGLVGGALSWVLYWLLIYGYNLPRTCRECLGVSVWRWYKEGLAIAVCTGVTYGAAWAFVSYRGELSLVWLAGAYGAATAVYAMLAYRMIAPNVRMRVVGQAARLMRLQPVRVRHG